MPVCFHLDIVSAEAGIYSGPVKKLFVSGILGELEVLNGHAPLLTSLKPGPVWVVNEDNKEEVFYISGGMLEVQPTVTTVLADTALRAKEVDEDQAIEAKKRAEEILAGKGKDFDYAKAQAELAEAIAQLRALKRLRDRGGH